MDKETNSKNYRDVQTMLFCKIAHHPYDDSEGNDNIYGTLCKQIAKARMGDQSSHIFLTFGGYDAICIYPTKLDSQAPDWLHEVYRDKQKIIRLPSNSIIYHQMHLVSQHPDTNEFWSVHDEEYPFFLATLIYGVNTAGLDKSREEAKTQGYASNPESGEIECSLYEQTIRRHLQNLFQEIPETIKYAVYNGITVSDVVILWRAKDLLEVMGMITRIEYSGIARKTLTTLGFPVDEEGRVKSCVIEELIHNPDKYITLSMHGAIRDVERFIEVKHRVTQPMDGATGSKIKDLLTDLAHRAYIDIVDRKRLKDALGDEWTSENLDKLSEENSLEVFLEQLQPSIDKVHTRMCCIIPNRIWSQSLGKNDFSVSARVSYANLGMLLDSFRIVHKAFYHACWEFLIDIRTEHPSEKEEWFHESEAPSQIVCDLYGDFQELFNKTDLTHYSWFGALQELLGTHHYIDHHPVLHGPSYLVYNSLKIAYAYLSGEVTDYETSQKRKRLLERSEENIIHFVQNLDQLTEQISRNDDAMLNNRSNTHTIHFSLPESALEFYHAFLRRIVDYLIAYDERYGLKPVGFEYDFLLSPKTCSQFRFRPMLKTEHKDHGNNPGKVWPQKQAYVLELPLESIFKPIDLFIPFVHECFHCFGDVLRQRAERKQYMALFIATNLLTVAGLGLRENQALCAGLARQIYGPIEYGRGTYLNVTLKQLKLNTYRILQTNMLNQVFSGFASDDTLRCLAAVKQRYGKGDINPSSFAGQESIVDAILENCNVYFKECYADAMTIALLRLTPSEYLQRAREELRRSRDYQHSEETSTLTAEQISHQSTHIALRFAIVLAACCKQNDRLKHFTISTCREAIGRFDMPMLEHKGSCLDFSGNLLQSFESLIDFSKPMPPGSSLHPPAALYHVIDYLITSIDLLYKEPPNLRISDESGYVYNMDNLAEDFDHIIRKGNMFGTRFYSLIYSHHTEVRNKAINSAKT